MSLTGWIGGAGWRRKMGRAGRSQSPRRYVAARSKSRRSRRAVSPGVIKTVAGVGLTAVIGWMGYAAWQDYFRDNSDMRLRRLIIDSGQSVSPAFVREWTGIHEGIGLFDVDIAAVRNKIVAEAPHIRELQIIRELPDTMVIRVFERQPLARIGRDGPLVADAEGLVFVRHRGVEMLPSVIGGRGRFGHGQDVLVVGGERQELRPGHPLRGMAMAGLQVLRLIDEPGYRLPVIEVDVSPRDHIALRLSDQREIKLAWEGMGASGEMSRYRLRRRMLSVLRVLSDPASGSYRYFDATVDDQRIIGR